MKILKTLKEAEGKTIKKIVNQDNTTCFYFTDDSVLIHYDLAIIDDLDYFDLREKFILNLISNDEYEQQIKAREIERSEARKQMELKRLAELKAKYEK